MNRIRFKPLLLLAAGLAFLPSMLAAQPYELLNSVFSNGGGVVGDSSSFRLNFAIGEPAVGEGSDSLYSLQGGFIYAAETIVTDGLCPLAWQTSLIVRDAGGNKATLFYGQGVNATNDLDVPCREAELPPVPPAGVFDARLELPVSPPKSSLDDYRSNREQTINWRIRFQPGATGAMVFSWSPAAFPAGSFFLKDEVTGALVNVNMKTQSSYTLTSALNSLKIEYRSSGGTTTRPVSASSGWNILSVPLLAADMSTTGLFPGAASQAFAYNNGYVAASTLVNGKGYWLKFNNPASFTITGTPPTNREITISTGWNIIGPFESEVAVAAITSTPAGIVTSSYFGYNNGYTAATTLTVGKGYWVKASQAGTLRLPGGGANAKIVALETPLLSAQKTKDSWPSIVIQDSEGNTGTLYLAPAQEFNGHFERPPLPPAGIFDVRFSSNKDVENLESGRHEIQISSAKFPIRVKAQNFKERILSLSAGAGEGMLDETLADEKEIIIVAALSKIILAESEIPLRYALSQNQPNPFNPTTLIKFALPEKARVQIAVYNMLGEKVAELVNQELPPGYHQTEFNALRYASGVYFYVMEAGAFRDLKKMLIVK